MDKRTQRAKLNIVISLLSQLLTLVCGLIVPRLLIKTFGSQAYGATTSIASFLGYITLLEGGIGGVARAALYKPLAENDEEKISLIVEEIKRFFKAIAIIFLVYVAFLALSFKSIGHVEVYDQASTALLVIVISISTFAQYFIGISYSVLLQAAQRVYIVKLIQMTSIFLNAVASVVLVKLNCSLILIKLLGSLVFTLRPFLLWWYVKKNFNLPKVKKTKESLLTQKWNGLSQHIAYFIHTNTDVAVLTLLVNLSSVTVYSVYHMVTSEITNIANSFATGMEAVFGDMLAKKEMKQLHKTFSYYETLISFISLFLFGVTAVMLISFVKVYTSKIDDVEFIYPAFGLIMVLGCFISCLRQPYHSMVIAAGHFRQTQFAAYGEAAINIVTSIIAVKQFGLIGVAIGTLVAISFRYLYYAIYLQKHIMHFSYSQIGKRLLVNAVSFTSIYFIGLVINNHFEVNSYFTWVICAAVVSALALVIVTALTAIFYKEDLKPVIQKILKRR